MNCKEMTKLISDSMEAKVTLRQRMELWMHIAMCGMCRSFRSNARALRRVCRSDDSQSVSGNAGGSLTTAEQSLSSSAKQRIASAIKKQLS